MKRIYFTLAMMNIIGAIILTIINIPILSILGFISIFIGYIILRKYENISDIEYTLKYEILLEDFLDRMIKARDKDRSEFKLDKELKEFIDSLDQIEFQKLLEKLSQ
jgi:hypothetical protein